MLQYVGLHGDDAGETALDDAYGVVPPVECAQQFCEHCKLTQI